MSPPGPFAVGEYVQNFVFKFNDQKTFWKALKFKCLLFRENSQATRGDTRFYKFSDSLKR